VSTPATYFEDVGVGDVEVTPAMTLTEAHAALYRGLTSDSPDEPGLIPELVPMCLITGLGWRLSRPPLAVLAFMSIEWKRHRSLRVGDTIHCQMRVAVKRSLRDGGVVIQDQEVIDQSGEVAQSGRFTFLVAKRAADPAPAGGRRLIQGGHTT
jgi:acyl dehydratase